MMLRSPMRPHRLASLVLAMIMLTLIGSVASGHIAHFPPPDDVLAEDEPSPVGGTFNLKNGSALGLDYTLSAFTANQGGICLNLEYSGAMHGYSGGCGFQSVPTSYKGDLETNAIAITVDEMPAPVDGTIVAGVASRNASQVSITVNPALTDPLQRNATIINSANFGTNFFIAILPGTGLTGTVTAEDDLGAILQVLSLS